MLVLNRFTVPAEREAEFRAQAETALEVLAARSGYVSGELTRSLDEPDHWCLVTRWESVGAYRRALGHFDVRVHATPLLAQSHSEPSAYETLAAAEPNRPVTVTASDRAEPDAPAASGVRRDRR